MDRILIYGKKMDQESGHGRISNTVFVETDGPGVRIWPNTQDHFR